MGDGLIWISQNPARSFREACQAAIMYQLFLALETGYPPTPSAARPVHVAFPQSRSGSRPDYGRCSPGNRRCLFPESQLFLWRRTPIHCHNHRIGNTYQHTTIGGVDPDTGDDATNPVTYMVLEPSAGWDCMTRPFPCASTKRHRTNYGTVPSKRLNASAACPCSRMTTSSFPA